MKKLLTTLLIASALFLTGCIDKTPLTEDQKIYAGKWVSNDGTWFQIYNNGGGDFEKSNSNVTGGATTFTETGFEIGLFGLSAEFVIDKEPTIVDERLIMQVNGDMYLNVTPKIISSEEKIQQPNSQKKDVNNEISSEKTKIKEIKEEFSWINNQTDFTIIQLEGLDFLPHPTDNGASITGYYKNHKLHKIITKIGLSYAIMTTEYYFKNDELIFVYDTEHDFKHIIDPKDGFIGFDYSEIELKYESRHYFFENIEIKKIEKGKRLMEQSTFPNIDQIDSYKKILNQKNK